MNDEEVMERYGVSKKFGIRVFFHMLLIILAFAISIVGIMKNTDLHRMIIYSGQALTCVCIFIFGFFKFKDRDRIYFRVVLNAYALLEALRASLLNTTGVNPWIGALARFLLVILACQCVLIAEKMDRRSREKNAIFMVCTEIALYLIYIFGFPGVMLGHLNRVMPIVGVLIAATIALLQQGKNIQLGVVEDKDIKCQ